MMLRKHTLLLTFVEIVLIISIGQRLNAQEANEFLDLLQNSANSRNETIHINSISENSISEGNENLIDFDTLALCQDSIRSIIFVNNSNSAYTLDTAIITGVDKDKFSIVIKPRFPLVVNPGAIYSFAIAYGFGPNSTGNKSARLEIFADSSDVPLKIVNLKCYVESFDYSILPDTVDFGAIPTFSSRTKTIDFDNQSMFEIVYKIEYSNNPDIILSAFSGIIAAFGSGRIDVTVRSGMPGDINEQLMFVFESPCTDTIWINIAAELQYNDPIVTKNLDFGEIVLCDGSMRIIRYENTLDVPVYLNSVKISGPGSNLFSVQGIISPVVIMPDSTYEHEVIFASTGSFAGFKIASAVSNITYESVEKNYSTELTGTLLPTLSFSEQEIDFGEIDVGEFAEKTFMVFNNTARQITVNEVRPFINSQIFLLSPVVADTVLGSGDWIEFTIQFLPDKNMTYFDTLMLAITDGNCSTDIPVSITGSGIQNLDIWIPSLYAEISLEDFFIPIKHRINISKSSLINVSFEIHINMNSKMFKPTGLTNGFTFKSKNVVGNERIMVIQGEGLALDGKSSTLTAIYGQVLLSQFTYTPIEIKNFSWSESISSTIRNGELTVRSVCNQQLGTIRFYSLSEMKVYKEHGSSDVRIEVSSGETGRFELFYIDLLGRTERVASWQQSNPTDAIVNEFIINAAGLYGNVYNIWLRTPMSSLSRLITVVR